MDQSTPDGWEADVVLRDGHTVRIRSIRPDDAERIGRFHERQSSESIYFRFFSPRPTLTERELEHFTHVDHHDRVAFVALLDEEIVAVARYERYEGTDTAEVAFFVDDAHNGRGLATLMLEYLAAAARENGIVRFRASTLPNNRKMLKVFAVAGYDVATQLEDGVVDVAFDLAPTGDVAAAVDRRERLAEAASVRRMLMPRSVAVVSARGSGHAAAMAARLRAGGFSGTVEEVDPEHPEGLAEGTDLVLLDGSADAVAALVDAAGRRGAGAAIVLDPVEQEGIEPILDAARRHGLRLLGPGSAGVVNTDPDVRLNALVDGPDPRPGRAALLAASRDVVGALVDHARHVDLGLSTLVSVDVAADVNVADLLSYWAEDARTAVVLLHLGEGPLPGRLVRAARAASLAKPVVALRTATGRPGPRRSELDRRDDAVVRQSGVIAVDGLQQLFAVGRLVADQPTPTGRRVAVVGGSDGAIALAATACIAAGLEPVPVSSSVDVPAGVRVAEGDSRLDALLVVDPTTGAEPAPALAEAVLRVASRRRDMTVVVSTIGGRRPARLVDDATGVAVPVFTYPEHAANAMGRLVEAGEWRSTARVYGDDPPSGVDAEAARRLVDGWRSGAGSAELVLDSDRSEQLLATFGLLVAQRRPVLDVDEAVAAAEEIGWPVVLKARRRDRRIRTALGGVALDLADEEDLRSTWDRMLSSLGEEGMVPAVVQRLVVEGLDTAVRVRRSDGAPTVEVGLGGPSARFDPWELGVVPLGLSDATLLVASSSIGRALTDPLDRVPMVALVHRIAALADAVDEIHEIVVDPVVVSGPSAWITDVRIVLGEPRGELPVRHLG